MDPLGGLGKDAERLKASRAVPPQRPVTWLPGKVSPVPGHFFLCFGDVLGMFWVWDFGSRVHINMVGGAGFRISLLDAASCAFPLPLPSHPYIGLRKKGSYEEKGDMGITKGLWGFVLVILRVNFLNFHIIVVSQ